METVGAPMYEFHQPKFVGSRLVRCRLEERELAFEVEGELPLRIPYQDITAVHLSGQAHGRNEALLTVREFRCRVMAGQQEVVIPNRSDRGVGHRYRYENQAFRSFVHELHCRLLPFREKVQFRSGHNLYFRLTVAASALAAIVIPFRLHTYEGHMALGVAIYLSAVAGLSMAASRLRPRSYSPTEIPENLLPEGKDRRGFLA
jgi:hypothetical protein